MQELSIDWPTLENEHGDRMLWFGSWLIGSEGREAGWFYSGRGGERTGFPVPSAATGLRIRRWPNEGLEPEYVDVVGIAGLLDLCPAELDFDARQRFSLMRQDVA